MPVLHTSGETPIFYVFSNLVRRSSVHSLHLRRSERRAPVTPRQSELLQQIDLPQMPTVPQVPPADSVLASQQRK